MRTRFMLGTVLLLLALVSRAHTQERSWSVALPGPVGLYAGHTLPDLWSNDYLETLHIRGIACKATGGSVTISVHFAGPPGTALLMEPLVCDTEAWKAGRLVAPAPALHSFARTGAPCADPPCAMTLTINAVEGTPTYCIVKVVASDSPRR